MSLKYPLFGSAKPLVVGSMKEGTKVGDIDEADMTLVLDNTKFKQYFEFDSIEQRILVRKFFYSNKGWFGRKKHLELLDELKPFVINDTTKPDYYGYIDSKKLFLTFFEEFHQVILTDDTIKTSEGIRVSTNFQPCSICTSRENIRIQYKRCRHEEDCQEHLKTIEDPDYKENCNCKIFTSPGLSYSKIGLVLHLEFNNKDGTKFNLDVDVCPPTFPLSNKMFRKKRFPSFIKVLEEPAFDGSNQEKRAWLEKNRPVNWIEEWIKSEDMSEATGEGDDLKRCVQFRFFNNRDVIAEQVNVAFIILALSDKLFF